jgi:hypothetical protein
MSLMTLTEKSQTRSYSFLSSRVSEAVTEVEKDSRLPTTEERKVLAEGLELLDKFILGSRLVEGDDFKDGLLPTTDTLTAYGYAMTTLRALETLRNDDEVSQVLKSIRKQVQDVLEAPNPQALDHEKLGALREFFTMLATLLCQDIIRLRFDKSSTSKSSHGFPLGEPDFLGMHI